MKINMNYIKIFGGILLVIALFSFTNGRNDNKKLSKVNIEFVEGENQFITYPMVNKLLIQNEDTITNVAKENLALNRLEDVLNRNQMIREAQVYYTINGQLEAKIKQREPIARVGTSDPFYLDSEGKWMPLSPVFSARVPLITGAVNKENLAETYKLAKYVYEDDFLNRNIIGIHKRGGKFELKLRVDDFLVLLGNTEQLERKFRNFKAFYQKARKDKTLNTYSVVNLQYNNQVVCTKK
ncbi:hypothetical protein GWK08_03420 [Leptobacterium flavescens]|uniref:Cell division protein FtsQ n=1 Tax=Leptobacterium flavescens TaxID=472055 RepID=A0A6P0UQ16_9FLAO|nr:cell division protein FtsQ/DivIB [Leptobacterium flavescens]NER12476.1 hypothetical protein [Leptobacterium flavescens]